MSMMTLRLADTNEPTADILPFERRRQVRRPIDAQVTALREPDDQGGTLRKICSLQLTDICEGGLGAVTAEPLELGCPITIYFQPHGLDIGHDTTGRVVRCTRTQRGHEIGVCFEARAAA